MKIPDVGKRIIDLLIEEYGIEDFLEGIDIDELEDYVNEYCDVRVDADGVHFRRKQT